MLRVRRQETRHDHLHLSNSEVKNAWSCASNDRDVLLKVDRGEMVSYILFLPPYSRTDWVECWMVPKTSAGVEARSNYPCRGSNPIRQAVVNVARGRSFFQNVT